MMMVHEKWQFIRYDDCPFFPPYSAQTYCIENPIAIKAKKKNGLNHLNKFENDDHTNDQRLVNFSLPNERKRKTTCFDTAVNERVSNVVFRVCMSVDYCMQ